MDENPKCPICSGGTTRLFQKNGYWIRGCSICRHRLAEISLEANHVHRVYDDSYFQGDKDGYPDYLKDAELLIASGQRYGEILNNHLSTGNLFDVGCAAGFISKGLQEAGWKVSAIEPNRTMSEYASHLLGIQVESISLENYCSKIQYDVITMIQVLPHFYDLRTALQVAANLTRPGGFWLIETFNRDSLTARNLGQHWHEYSPPSVLNWFSKSGLERIVGQYGFSPVTSGRAQKRINLGRGGKILVDKLSKKSGGKNHFTWFNLVPEWLSLPYFLDDIFWELLQKK